MLISVFVVKYDKVLMWTVLFCFPKWKGNSLNSAKLTKSIVHELVSILNCLCLSGCAVTLWSATQEVASSNTFLIATDFLSVNSAKAMWGKLQWNRMSDHGNFRRRYWEERTLMVRRNAVLYIVRSDRQHEELQQSTWIMQKWRWHNLICLYWHIESQLQTSWFYPCLWKLRNVDSLNLVLVFNHVTQENLVSVLFGLRRSHCPFFCI